MARYCTSCGTPNDDNAGFCSKCGQGFAGVTAGGAAVASNTSGLTDNVAGMLAYVTIIPAILFLVLAPYNRNRFIRFHAFQCIFFWVFFVVVRVVLLFIPILGWVAFYLVSLAVLALWIVLLIKAYGGQKWKLPVIGDIAEKQADMVA
jgi:uncharacterized membrane protein